MTIPLNRMGGKYKPVPEDYVSLSKPGMVCVDHEVKGVPYGSITVIVNLVALPPGPIVLTLNDRYTDTLEGASATWDLKNVGLGQHALVVEAAGKRVERSFSVWVCR